MPELPEVETVAHQLDQAITGCRIKALAIHDDKLLHLDPSFVTGCRIDSVERQGKQVVISLIPPRGRKAALWMCVHLRMTGRLIYRPHLANTAQPKQQPRAILELDRGQVLFIDTRRFGTIELQDDYNAVLPVGVEPLSRELTTRRLSELINDSSTPLKTWLLRQDRLVGLGNIYASEVCNRAGIHPTTPAGSLNMQQLARLLKAIKHILRAAIKHCGTTFSDFQDTTGGPGGYVKYLQVYGRAGQPCRKCLEPVQRIVLAQRSTFLCPVCQPMAPVTG